MQEEYEKIAEDNIYLKQEIKELKELKNNKKTMSFGIENYDRVMSAEEIFDELRKELGINKN